MQRAALIGTLVVSLATGSAALADGRGHDHDRGGRDYDRGHSRSHQVERRVGVPQVVQAMPNAMPSPSARLTGFVIGVVTASLGGFLIWDSATSGGAGVDLVLRAIVGAFLIALGVGVGALCIAPLSTRRLFRR